MKDNVRSRKNFLFGVFIVLIFVLGSLGSGYAVNNPPVCDANGPYQGECQGATTSITLDGTGSSDPDADPLIYSWTTNCTDGSFDDDTSPTPYLTINSNNTIGCTTTLTVDDDYGGIATCDADVSVIDTTAPVITCPDDVWVLSTSPYGAVVTFSPTASDICFDDPDISCIPASGAPFPIGTTSVTCTATDDSGNTNSCGFTVEVTVAIDIKPQSCPNSLNVNSKGRLSVAILGTADFDVAYIDPVTILLEGVSPFRWEWEDVSTPFNGASLDDSFDCSEEGPDGYMDFTLLFSMQEIALAIDPVSDGDVLELTIVGELFDGTAFEGIDVVLIRKKKD